MSSTTADQDHLIQTKLYPPRTSVKVVIRKKLIDRLNENSSRQFTLISAAAGYGKSTLAYQWLSAHGNPFAWLSLDEYDSKLEQFVDYLIAAIRSLEPDIGQTTKDLLKSPRLPGVVQLANRFLRDLQDLSRPVFLVLDDFHVIQNSEILQFVSRLIQQPPANLHLVIITRLDPPLPLANLRGRSQLQEIRSHDLCFTGDEAAILLEQIVGEPVEREIVNSLNRHTEGWPAGLRMAATSLLRSDDQKMFVQRYAESGHKPALDYLLGEVLDNLPNEERLLMITTSVADRFCAPLIDILSEGSIPGIDGSDLLEELWSSNFFVVALDDQGIWYRYHQLFRQLLQQQLNKVFSSQAIAVMHLQASLWFEEAGFFEDALIQALKAGEGNHAAELVEKHVHTALDREDWRLAERWLASLPEPERQRPGLLAIQAALAQLRFRLDAIPEMLDAAEEGLRSKEFGYSPQQEKEWQGVINCYRATIMSPYSTPRESLHLAQKALQQIAPKALYVRGVADIWYVWALQQVGEVEQALREVRKKLAVSSNPTNTRTLRLMLAHISIYYAEADLFGLRHVAQTYGDMALRTRHLISVGWANYMLGFSDYQENKLAEAEAFFLKALEFRDTLHVRCLVDCMTGLVLIYKARNEPDRALGTVHALKEYMGEHGLLSMLPVADSLNLRLESSDITEIFVSNNTLYIERQLTADTWEVPVLTACRHHTRSGDPGRLALSADLLDRCRRFAEARNNKRQLMQIGALQALHHEVCGDRQAALALLSDAVLVGEHSGALRYFVDLGPELIPLLNAVRDRGIAADYIERILNAYGEAELTGSGLLNNVQDTLNDEAVFILGELTAREMEILNLLNKRLTNKEIAAKLHISPSTVTKHTIALYEKLEVRGRRRAVARATQLGILPNNA